MAIISGTPKNNFNIRIALYTQVEIYGLVFYLELD